MTLRWLSYFVGDDALIVPRADVGIRPYELT